MKLKLIFWTFLLIVGNTNAKSKWILTGNVTGFKGDLTCVIYSYKDGNEFELTKIQNSKGLISYSFDESIEEGVFRIVLFDDKNASNFDFILTNEESKVQFAYDFSDINNLPVFVESKCNQNWYSFIKHQIEIKKNIDELESYRKMIFSTDKAISSEDSDKVIKKIQNEFLNIKKEFISTNINKFSTLMVKCRNFNDLNFNVEKDCYINEDILLSESINNKNEFLNTPLFKDYIHFNVLKSALNTSSINERKSKIKDAFSSIIDKFSGNRLVKKCAIRYAIEGFKEMNDEELSNYFSVKYDYRM